MLFFQSVCLGPDIEYLGREGAGLPWPGRLLNQSCFLSRTHIWPNLLPTLSPFYTHHRIFSLSYICTSNHAHRLPPSTSLAPHQPTKPPHKRRQTTLPTEVLERLLFVLLIKLLTARCTTRLSRTCPCPPWRAARRSRFARGSSCVLRRGTWAPGGFLQSIMM